MGIVSYLVSLVVVGLVIGGLGRLIVPGPNRIGLGATLGVGLTGAIVGAVLGRFLGLGFFSIVFELALSAGLAYLVSHRDSHGGRLAAPRHQ